MTAIADAGVSNAGVVAAFFGVGDRSRVWLAEAGGLSTIFRFTERLAPITIIQRNVYNVVWYIMINHCIQKKENNSMINGIETGMVPIIKICIPPPFWATGLHPSTKTAVPPLYSYRMTHTTINKCSSS